MMNPTRLLFYLLSAVLFIIPAMHTSQAQPINTRLQLENVKQFLLSNDQNRVLVVNTDGDLVIHDIRSGAILLTIETAPFNAQLNDLSWSSDDMLIGGAFSDRARIWNSHTGILVADPQDYPRQPVFEDAGSDVHGIVFSPTEPIYAISSFNDTSVLLYDFWKQEIKYELAGIPESSIWDVMFSPNGAYLAIQQFNGDGTIWNMQTGESIGTYRGETLAFSPDNRLLATSIGRIESNIWIWDLYNGEQLHHFTAPLNVHELQWSADSQTLYGLSGEQFLVSDGFMYNGHGIRSWNRTNPSAQRLFALTETLPLRYDIEENMTLVGIGAHHAEGFLLLWDPQNQKSSHPEQLPETPEQDYTVLLEAIFTFDIHHERGLIAGGHENGIRLWHIASGEYVDLLPDTRIYQLEFLDDRDELIIRTSQNELIVLTLEN